MKPWKYSKWVLVILAAVFIIQFAYFASIYSWKPGPEKPDLVVVYGAITNKSYERGLELAHQFNCPIYFAVGIQTIRSIIDKSTDQNLRMTFDPRARTTDQNARYSAAFIQKGGYKCVALVCAWDHMPRALFLARLYLLGSGVQINLYPDVHVPARFWITRNFWIQMFRFWGSLVRVGLHWVGIDDWPTHPHAQPLR